jgi:hypothetical protein
LFAFVLIASAGSLRAEERLPILPIPGIELIQGETREIQGPESPLAFKFNDGRICLDGGYWSHDNGKTWTKGPPGPEDKMAFDFGDGEILSVSRNLVPRPDGKHTVVYKRSTDNWKTVQPAEGIADVPLATSLAPDNMGPRVPSMMMHHGMVQLKDGTLLASLYGSYKGDSELKISTAPESGQVKRRTVVISSSDRGKTWGNPVTVGYNTALGLLYKPNITGNKWTIVPAQTQEGFTEPDLVIAPNGDIICVMRTGSGATFGPNGEDVLTPDEYGRFYGALTVFPTPLHASRSSDGGKTWTPPASIADRGCCPHLITLGNGIIVCVYNRPGVWLLFSDDNGKTWKGPTQISLAGRRYTYMVETGSDSIIVFREQEMPRRSNLVLATSFIVRKRG